MKYHQIGHDWYDVDASYDIESWIMKQSEALWVRSVYSEGLY